MLVSRARERAAAKAQNLLHHTAEQHQKPVEEHRSTLCQFVSVLVCTYMPQTSDTTLNRSI